MCYFSVKIKYFGINLFIVISESNACYSDSKALKNLATLDSLSHMKKKASLSEEGTILDNEGRTETNLEWPGKQAPRSKSVPGNTIPEIISANQDQKISGNLSSPILESKLAIDNTNSLNNSNSNIMSNSHTSVNDLGAGTGNTNRTLRPRHHMDKLSE